MKRSRWPGGLWNGWLLALGVVGVLSPAWAETKTGRQVSRVEHYADGGRSEHVVFTTYGPDGQVMSRSSAVEYFDRSGTLRNSIPEPSSPAQAQRSSEVLPVELPALDLSNTPPLPSLEPIPTPPSSATGPIPPLVPITPPRSGSPAQSSSQLPALAPIPTGPRYFWRGRFEYQDQCQDTEDDFHHVSSTHATGTFLLENFVESVPQIMDEWQAKGLEVPRSPEAQRVMDSYPRGSAEAMADLAETHMNQVPPEQRSPVMRLYNIKQGTVTSYRVAGEVDGPDGQIRLKFTGSGSQAIDVAGSRNGFVLSFPQGLRAGPYQFSFLAPIAYMQEEYDNEGHLLSRKAEDDWVGAVVEGQWNPSTKMIQGSKVWRIAVPNTDEVKGGPWCRVGTASAQWSLELLEAP